MDSKKESKMIFRGLALVSMWMRVPLSNVGKIRFTMMGKTKIFFFLCQVWDV